MNPPLLNPTDGRLSGCVSALEFTKRAVDDDAANLVERRSGQKYDWATECVISAGGLSGILNVLLATLELGDEVLLTDPIYVGLINRARLAGGVPRFVFANEPVHRLRDVAERVKKVLT